MWTTKKTLKEHIATLEAKLAAEYLRNDDLQAQLKEFAVKYPFDIGQTVYDLQLRNDKGRYTKKNPSREHSVVNEVVVDKKNYFNLVDRYADNDVFVTYEAAEKYLDEVCKG